MSTLEHKYENIRHHIYSSHCLIGSLWPKMILWTQKVNELETNIKYTRVYLGLVNLDVFDSNTRMIPSLPVILSSDIYFTSCCCRARLLKSLSSFVMALNASLGLFVYCLASKQFRDEIRKNINRWTPNLS